MLHLGAHADKTVNNMKLQNMIMQLRKVSLHVRSGRAI